MKARPADYRGTLAGKQIVLFFEKPSLRTRLTFEAGINSLGGVSFFVDQTQSRLGARESLSDVAHNLERWVDGVVLRTFAHETVTTMATHASIPVINALSELEHPCQAHGGHADTAGTFWRSAQCSSRLSWRWQQCRALADACGRKSGSNRSRWEPRKDTNRTKTS